MEKLDLPRSSQRGLLKTPHIAPGRFSVAFAGRLLTHTGSRPR